MGRLVYVREDREAEPRFSNPTSTRGGAHVGPGFGGPPFGGHGHAGGGFGGPPAGGSRQVYIANVC
jgi:hypothetical protein